MNNATLKAFFDKYGDRICWIGLNNGYRIYIGYKSSHIKSVNDIKLETVSGTDFYALPQIPEALKDPEITNQPPVYTTYHLTELIETFCIMEEDYKGTRLDPYFLQ